MKKSTHNPTDSPEKQHFKKGYLQRKLEEKEANAEIAAYKRTEGPPDVHEAQDVETKRPV